jgi:iron complex outermembrane recepter protein
MKKMIVRALSAAATVAAAQIASAQGTAAQSNENDPDTVVVTSQKLVEGSIGGWLPVPLTELPRTVMVIDEETISKQFVNTTKDILKNIPGVQIMPDNNLAGYQTPYIRGIQSNQYFEGQYSAGVTTSMPEVIGRAEVLQGFNSLQFAIDTGGGAVNYFMKRPTAQNFLQTELQATSWGGGKFVVDGNMHLGNAGETDGIRFVGVIDRDQTYVRGYPRKEGNSGSIMGRYSGLAGVQIDVDVSYWDIKNDPSNQYFFFTEPPAGGTIPDLDPRVNVTQDWSEGARRKGEQLGLRLSRNIGENWKALVAVAYDRTMYTNDGCTVSVPDFETGEASYSCAKSGFGPLWDKQIRFDLTGKFTLFGMEHYTAIGLRRSGQKYNNTTDRTPYNDPPYNTQNIFNPRSYPAPTGGVTTPPNFFRSSFDDTVTYFQDRITLHPKWDLWAGVGYVENEGAYGGPTFPTVTLPNTHAVVPTGALVFKPTSASSYYFSYSEGVSRVEVIAPDPTIINAGEILPAIHSKAYEIGGKWTLAERVQLNLAVFKMQQPLAITEQVQATPPLFRRYAGGLSEFTGVSVDFRGKLSRALEIQGGFVVLDPVVESAQDVTLNGKKTPGVSRRSGTLNVGWDVGAPAGLTLDGGVYFQGDMPLNARNTYDLDGFTRIDFGATYETLWDDREVRFRLLLENAFDDEFYYGFPYGVQPAAPRTLNASVAVRF